MIRGVQAALVLPCAGLAALQPRAAVLALFVSGCLAATGARRTAAGLLIALLAAAPLGLRVDAAPPSPSSVRATQR